MPVGGPQNGGATPEANPDVVWARPIAFGDDDKNRNAAKFNGMEGTRPAGQPLDQAPLDRPPTPPPWDQRGRLCGTVFLTPNPHKGEHVEP